MSADILSRLWRRVQVLVSRGKTTGVVDNSGNVLKMQVAGMSPGAVQDLIRLVQHYGFTSVPPNGTDAIILALGGEPSNSVIIATNHGQYRLKLQMGDVALYDRRDQCVKLTDEGIVHDAPVVRVVNTLKVGNGASGTFTTPTGQTVTVEDGIITNIF